MSEMHRVQVYTSDVKIIALLHCACVVVLRETENRHICGVHTGSF